MCDMTDDAEARRVGSRFLETFYRAVESSDPERLRRLLRRDAIVFTPTADGVLTSTELVIADIQRWLDAVGARGGTLRLRSDSVLAGAAPSGQCLWVFDQLIAEEVHGDTVVCSVPIRLTALLALDEEWRMAAAYWSVPFRTQEVQDAVKHAGALEPGMPLDEAVAPDARPLVDALQAALDRPGLLPTLYSTRDDHVTIGSVVEEVFVGVAGRSAWEEFVQYVTEFARRGPMRAALVAPDAGWLAANVDIGKPATPYRFFYIWLQEESGWRIVVSHDAVSRDPLASGVS